MTSDVKLDDLEIFKNLLKCNVNLIPESHVGGAFNMYSDCRDRSIASMAQFGAGMGLSSKSSQNTYQISSCM